MRSVAPQVMVVVNLDRPFRRVLELDDRVKRLHTLSTSKLPAFSHGQFPQPRSEVGGLGHVTDDAVFAVFGFEGCDEGQVVPGWSKLWKYFIAE